MLKKITLSFLISSILVLPIAFADHAIPEETAAETPIQFSVFTRETCSHCAELEEFLTNDFDVEGVQAKLYHLEDDETYDLFTKFCDENDLIRATPTILIGDQIVQGFESAETTGAYIVKLASEMTESSYFETYESGSVKDSDEVVVHLPIFGTINLKDYSLGILAIVLGFIDGFNPCAMWVLIMFITLLSQSGNKRKMFELTGIFILAETIMYYIT